MSIRSCGPFSGSSTCFPNGLNDDDRALAAAEEDAIDRIWGSAHARDCLWTRGIERVTVFMKGKKEEEREFCTVDGAMQDIVLVREVTGPAELAGARLLIEIGS